MRKNLLTCFGIKKNKISITFITVVGAFLGVIISIFLSLSSLFSLAFALSIILIFEIDKFLQEARNKNDILISKIIGIWIALSATLFGAIKQNFPFPLFWGTFLAIAGFLLFSFWRPSTISWIDKNLKGGLGVILSEALAGFAGGMFALVLITFLSKII